MCNDCGCGITDLGQRFVTIDSSSGQGTTAVGVMRRLLHANDHQATHNRAHFDQRDILAVNLMSSPGSGKTALLEATIDAFGNELAVAVIEGDLETENDALRIRRKGVPVHQITTGTACHLDAHMVHGALHHLDLDGIDVLFIENVGNLVCPASFDLGHHLNVTLLSVTEGDDKPAKYPVMFRAADAMVLTKTDLLPFLDDFDPDRATQHLRALANPAPVISLSARTGSGMESWLDWLRAAVEAQRARVRRNQTSHPKLQREGLRRHESDTGAMHEPDS